MKINKKSALLVIDIQQEDFREMTPENADAPEWDCIRNAKRVLDVFRANNLPVILHEIKQLGGFRREDNSKFDRALIELQMRMFITMCGTAQKVNRYGIAYGWNSTVFTTVEDFWEKRGISLPALDPAESEEKIRAQIMKLNPDAKQKKIEKFIKG